MKLKIPTETQLELELRFESLASFESEDPAINDLVQFGRTVGEITLDRSGDHLQAATEIWELIIETVRGAK